MNRKSPNYTAQIAQSAEDILAAQRLRYSVFVEELGGDGPMVDHANRREIDRFDAFATQLVLRDINRPIDDQVVGVYRLMTQAAARAAGQFYCENEYDLTLLRQSGKRLLEVGRSCLHPDYRGGDAMMQMWSALGDYIKNHRIDVMFGVASFPGTDLDALAGPLALLYHRHLAPDHLRVTAHGVGARAMNTISEDQIDRIAAIRDTPALIKAYLRLGGVVGDGAFVDHSFNTTDICLILPTDVINALQRNIYSRGQGLG